MLLKGFNYKLSQRDTLFDKICAYLSSQNIEFSRSYKVLTLQLTFDQLFYDKCNLFLPDSLFFKQSAAAISAVFKLDLPYPLIHDTNGVAAKFIKDYEGKNLETMILEAGFEQKLNKAMIEGKAVLIINPTPSVYRILTPVIAMRSQVCFENFRGTNLALKRTIKISESPCIFNMAFRLYICAAEMPQSLVKSMSTVISMDLSDPNN